MELRQTPLRQPAVAFRQAVLDNDAAKFELLASGVQ